MKNLEAIPFPPHRTAVVEVEKPEMTEAAFLQAHAILKMPNVKRVLVQAPGTSVTMTRREPKVDGRG